MSYNEILTALDEAGFVWDHKPTYDEALEILTKHEEDFYNPSPISYNGD